MKFIGILIILIIVANGDRTTIQDLINQKSCSLNPVQGLSLQLVTMLN